MNLLDMAIAAEGRMVDDGGRLYRVFTRTWWRYEGGQRVPGAGRPSYRGHPDRLTYSEAQAYCTRWNDTHRPGPLSRKAEFEER